MKIALITRGFTGSILPLAKQMLADGYEIDIYIICNREKLDDIEAFECSYRARQLGLQRIPNHTWESVKKYLQSKNVRLFCVRYLRPYESLPIVKQIIFSLNNRYSKQCISFVNSQNYKMVNIVCGYYSKEYIPYIKNLKVTPIVSLHEVCNHFVPDYSCPSPLLNLLFNKKLPIIVYSDNSLKDIVQYGSVIKNRLYRINFGTFDSYRSVSPSRDFSLPSNYILFFGTLKKYKGLGVLYEAITKYNPLPEDMKCVVAGAGVDESFEQMKTDKRFMCIQKRLSNAELVRLISGAFAVVCPYLTVSQSGIPQTVFVFNKPIIASRLDGFTEILNDKNSLLFEKGDAFALSNNIKKLLNDNILYDSLVNEIKNFNNTSSPYSWKFIAGQYYKLAGI